MAAPALLFDVDGTLWDSQPWFAEVLAGLSGQAQADLQQRLAEGRPIVRLVADCNVADGKFCRTCIAGAGTLRLYPDVRETLGQLQNRGTRCGVVTSLPGRLVRPLLDGLELAHHFEVVIHAGTVRTRKPNPAPLREAARQMGLTDLDAVYYVGDAEGDASAAWGAGMQFAWASYGYGINPGNGAVVLRTFAEVLAL